MSELALFRTAPGKPGGLALALAAVLCAGCPSAASSSNRPEEVLRRYADAVAAKDYARAYDLLSDSFRRRHDLQQFVRLLEDNSAEIQASLAQARTRSTVRVEARVDYGDSDGLALVLEEGSWKIASDPLDFYSQRTPAEALRSFVRALERKRYEVVLRFVPARWAEGMTVDKLRREWEGARKDEVGTLIRNLKANLGAPIRRSGETASMAYGDKFEVRFVREDGVWKIEDPD